MSKRLSRGFTLIELLVVIAIIGILSSVVLASLNTARGKGANAAIKSNLNNIRAQAELVYDTASGSYAAVCVDPNVVKGVTAAASAGSATVGTVDAAGTSSTVVCQDTATAWAVQAPLKSTEGTYVYWCVDSTGASRGEAAVLGAATNVCS
jgi:type IV pilus assembly protein PilA